MKIPKLFKIVVLAMLVQVPAALLAQSPIPLMQFQFNEATASTTLTNTGSIVATATYTGTLSTPSGVSPFSKDNCFNNTGATGMGTLGTVGGVYVSTSAMGSALKSLTLQGWFKSNTVIGNGARLLDNYDTGTVSGFTLRGAASTETQGALYLLIDGQTVGTAANTFNNTSAWIFFAATYDSTSKAVKFYKGTTNSAVVQVGSAFTFGIDVGLANASATKLCLGNLTSNIRPYDGYLENIRIYGSTNSSTGALTLAQLETLRRGDVVNALSEATITVSASSIIRSDVDGTLFGSGVEHNNVMFRYAMTATGADTATRTMFQDVGMGWMRFPNGTAAQMYRWDLPAGSYLDGAPSGAWILTPDEMYTYTGTTSTALSMDRLFQVNTYRYWKGGIEKFVNQNNQSSPWIVDATKVGEGADYAAAWITNNRTKGTGNQVTYWEIGNEDWIYWGPAQYAQIFSAYATKMKAADSTVKLLAQTITSTRSYGGGVNDRWWTSSFAAALTSTMQGNVHAVSEHEYINGYCNTGLKDFSDKYATVADQREMQTQNMFGKLQDWDRLTSLSAQISSMGLNWDIWVTEYNVMQYQTSGAQMMMQDLGQGIVLADLTGRILSEPRVKKVFYHSLDHNPYFSMVDYLNGGGTLSLPIKTIPGYVYEKYIQEFGPVMVDNAVTANPSFNSYNEGPYSQLSVYSSVRDETDHTLRLIVINRSSTNGIRLAVQCAGRTMAAAPAQYQLQELYSANLTDTNRMNRDYVKWSNPVSGVNSSTVVDGIVLREHSVNLIVIPLQD